MATNKRQMRNSQLNPGRNSQNPKGVHSDVNKSEFSKSN